jgi:hypothetical protein
MSEERKIRDCIRALEARIEFLFDKFGLQQNSFVKAEVGALKYAIYLMEREKNKVIEESEGS